jgi:hypothetical protein
MQGGSFIKKPVSLFGASLALYIINHFRSEQGTPPFLRPRIEGFQQDKQLLP